MASGLLQLQYHHVFPLAQWFSAFTVLRPFNIFPLVVMTPDHDINFIATLEL